jgi:hypothetical protein
VKRFLSSLILLSSLSAFAMETQVLPQSTWTFEFAYLGTSLDKQWSGDGKPLALVEESRRYEPGQGLQGILRAKPQAQLHVLLIQALYGITDKLTAALYVPIVLNSRVATNLSWEPGDYQSSLGRQYSEEDFWGWASSLGQPRIPAVWETGPRLGDMILGGRYLLPQTEWMSKNFFRWSATLQVAIPTGQNFDPEEAVSVGTNLWELHAAGDVEAHVSADKHFFVDEHGVYRLNIGMDLFYSFFRPREYRAGHGLKNPLLNNNAYYVGDTYIVDGGDWLGGTISVDATPILGPTRASIVSGGDAEKAKGLPGLLNLNVIFTRIQTFQSDWQSQSPLWDWDREKFWQPGSKNLVRATATISFLRLGAPIQIYARYQSGDLVPGAYTRPAVIFSAGVRLVAKFW